MPKFAPDRFPPGFFDLPADAGEALPVTVIEQWTSSDQTVDAARAILGPHTRRGILVSTDAAGLTKLSRERPLVEILALINRPKELIHAWGATIGGEALGTWAADNTQMLYPEPVDAARVVAMLRSTQDALARERTVGIGFAAHRGVFYLLGDGVFGPDADRVEVVAEEHTEGGELVVSDTVEAALPPAHGFALAPRADLAQRFGGFARVTAGPTLEGVTPRDYEYPAPFTEAFHEELRHYVTGEAAAALPRPEARRSAVVLIEREQDVPDVPEAALLNDLALSAAMKRLAGELLPAHGGEEIKTSGLIGIYLFADPARGAAFAQEFRRVFAEQGVATRAGIDVGEVLVFDMGRGRREIAGAPVNVASKLAQDVGSFGRIYLSDVATAQARLERQSQTFRFDVSGVTLTARQM